jgi:hypothetical protein
VTPVSSVSLSARPNKMGFRTNRFMSVRDISIPKICRPHRTEEALNRTAAWETRKQTWMCVSRLPLRLLGGPIPTKRRGVWLGNSCCYIWPKQCEVTNSRQGLVLGSLTMSLAMCGRAGNIHPLNLPWSDFNSAILPSIITINTPARRSPLALWAVVDYSGRARPVRGIDTGNLPRMRLLPWRLPIFNERYC